MYKKAKQFDVPFDDYLSIDEEMRTLYWEIPSELMKYFQQIEKSYQVFPGLQVEHNRLKRSVQSNGEEKNQRSN